MISFESDYIKGAHPEILKRIMETNEEVLSGYGMDDYCNLATEKIRKACNLENAQVYFAQGGTQTNQLVISSMLKSYEGVIAPQTGHIGVHEAGAIEYSGHKVLTLPGHMGKLDSEKLNDYLGTFFSDDNREHMVFPGMVYISHPTEYGSLYSKEELTKIYAVCQNFEIPLYIDGARLSYALACEDSDVSLSELSRLCDVFYIGGTKVGAMFGEAIVFTKNNMPKHFVTLAKQRGALLAKGRFLGVQFDTLFTDDLYLEVGRHAMKQKNKLVAILKEAGIPFFYESPTNQQFVILENGQMNQLKSRVAFSFWESYDDSHTVVRFATSWSTTDEELAALSQILQECK